MKKSTKITLLIIVIISLCVLVSEECSYIFAPGEPDIIVNGEIGYEELTKPTGVKLKAVTGINFVAEQCDQTVDFSNEESNQYAIVVMILLGDGTILYESPQINPGESITEIRLSRGLAQGIYKNSLLVYKIYGKDGTFINQCEFQIEIRAF